MRAWRILLWCAVLPVAALSACGDDDDDQDVADTADVPDEVEDETPTEDVAEVPDEVADETTGDTDVEEDDGADVEDDGGLDVETTDDGADVEDDGGAEVPFCSEQPDGTACDDGDLCTTGEACASGACTGGIAVVCTDDSNPCTDDVCDPSTGSCVNTPNTAACDDGDWCTDGDACAGGACAPGAARDCSAVADLCNTASCDSTSETCVPVPVADGTTCDDLCTAGGTCASGVCAGATTVDCSAFDDDCNVGTCSPADGSCAAVPVSDGVGCDDSLACTSGDACASGICVGTPADDDGDTYIALGCLTGDDCDDDEATVNPAGSEGPMGTATCFDGFDNECDGLTDLDDELCGAGLDWANLQTPLTMTLQVGQTSPTVQGQVFEPGATESAGAMTGLTAQLGWGPALSDPSSAAGWTWGAADYWGQGGAGNVNDVYGGTFVAPPVGDYSYTYRYSTDGGTSWLYTDSDGNGAAPPSNGLQTDRLGALVVVVNNHLLFTEAVVAPSNREYVEIYNPTGAAVDLSNYYLTDAGDFAATWHYWNLVNGSGSIRAWDFVARFPAGATLAAGEYAVVSMGSAQSFNTAFGANPTFELCPGSPDVALVPNMRQAWSGSACLSPGPLNNSYETLILFTWNGTADLVQDVDILQWGATTEAVVKTGIAIDGPDSGTAATAYFDDTAVGSQAALTPAPHDGGGSYARTALGETGETRPAAANGLTGHDETSEDWASTWTLTLAATPGH